MTMTHVHTLEVDGVVVNVEEPLGDDVDGEQILIQNLVDELLQLGLSLDNEVTIYNKYRVYPSNKQKQNWKIDTSLVAIGAQNLFFSLYKLGVNFLWIR